MFRHRGRKEDVVRGVLAKSRLVTQKQMCSNSEILLNYSNEKITISGFGRKFILKLHLLFFSPRIQTKMAAAQFLPKPFIISSTVYCTVVYRYCFIIKNTHLHVSHNIQTKQGCVIFGFLDTTGQFCRGQISFIHSKSVLKYISNSDEHREITFQVFQGSSRGTTLEPVDK